MKTTLKKDEYNNLDGNEFDLYVAELNKIYMNDKKKANKIARRGLTDLGLLNKSITGNSLGINKEIAIIIAICSSIALCCFFAPNLELMGIYLFGMIFFFAGLFVGLYIPVFGLIFLFSHGGTGLFVMIMSLFGFPIDSPEIEKIFNNPIFTDGAVPKNIILFLCVVGIVFVSAFIYTIIHNLSPTLKKDKKNIIRILILFFIGIVLVILFPKIFPYLFA